MTYIVSGGALNSTYSLSLLRTYVAHGECAKFYTSFENIQ